ncbi:hypothetical protein HBA54_03230 [Pelagibius litoralis]|uniref:Uncharacterized protein n=1 Tax=Pelagibius litoralis TaxID=374515 RepID=A0A967EX42_9PROT|nr:hypothetical protein [Pelagibius litoralis]NIA67595.1 hypothetical protein [Pelagibius litoralis]
MSISAMLVSASKELRECNVTGMDGQYVVATLRDGTKFMAVVFEISAGGVQLIKVKGDLPKPAGRFFFPHWRIDSLEVVQPPESQEDTAHAA